MKFIEIEASSKGIKIEKLGENENLQTYFLQKTKHFIRISKIKAVSFEFFSRDDDISSFSGVSGKPSVVYSIVGIKGILVEIFETEPEAMKRYYEVINILDNCD